MTSKTMPFERMTSQRRFGPRAAQLLALLTLVGLSGCAIDAGTGFATLERATLEAHLDPGEARDLGDGALLTASGYEVRLNRATLRVERLELQEQTAASSVRFDPARPPPGYGSCHGGHCHRDDGALIPYEQIELELAGGAAAFRTMTTLRFHDALSLIDPEEVPATEFEPSRELSRGSLQRVVLVFERLVVDGSVTGGPGTEGLGNETIELSIRLPLSLQLSTSFEPLNVDRNGPKRVQLGTWLDIDGTVFDGIDFAALAQSGAVAIDDPHSTAGEALIAALAESTLAASFGKKPAGQEHEHDDHEHDEHDDHEHDEHDDHEHEHDGHDGHEHDAGHHDHAHEHDAGHHDEHAHDHDAGHHDDHDHDHD